MGSSLAFLSYRVDDAAGDAKLLYDRLAEAFGSDRVYLDTSRLQPGDVFPAALEQALANATCLLAVIGKQWLLQHDEFGRRRIDDPDDWVRRELERAFARGIPVIPLTVRDAKLPPARALPESLASLAARDALNLGHKSWERDLAALLAVLRERYGFGAGTTAGSTPPAEREDPVPAAYLDWLRTKFGSVELLGLDVVDSHVPRLSQIYVPAVTAASQPEPIEERGELASDRDADRPRYASLLARLDTESLYVAGPAGAGKSTFCRWVIWLAASGELRPHPFPAPDGFAEHWPASFGGRLPLYVPLRSLGDALEGCGTARTGTRAVLEQCLVNWVEHDSPGGLTGAALRSFLASGRVLLVFDGFDEVPTSAGPEHARCYPRELLLSALTDALPTWTKAGARVLLTSRPYGLRPTDVQGLGLTSAPLEPLPRPLQELFVARWFAAADPERAAAKRDGLLADLARRAGLHELTTNPMLLTALCVRFNQGERLPEDRFQLYDSVVNAVLYGRYPDEARERGPVRRRLAAIALGMHTGSAPRQDRASPAAEVAESEVDAILAVFALGNRAIEGAEATLNDAAQKRGDLLSKSGLLLPRDRERVAFYHLSFQDFFAAEHLLRTTHADADLLEVLRVRSQVPGWHATLGFLLAAIALRHRDEQWAVDALFELAGEQTRERVCDNPQTAVFLAECIDLALAKGWFLGELRERFVALCLHAIEDEVAVPARARLALTLGRLGDPRPGVAVRDDGVPDIDWVRVPAGRVEIRDKELYVREFEIARYPITVAQFAAFAGAPDGGASAHEPRWTDPNTPRVDVSWHDAVAFCRWLSLRLGGEVRLPSEAEWQQAATGGDAAREYPWGEWRDGCCNSEESELERTTAVGLFPAGVTSHGVHEMAGNVWEWCSDEHEWGGGFRVVRGGFWISPARGCRSAFRDWWRAGYRLGGVGFRPARLVTH
ncbi:MAG: SUMF1/EgtB/PvdO family nonheme iron enzyme [Planctomycetes bacterium]|nr:SUMF1/EgtB/PvdO family nonheme iron enzyme [Planctomycetota bacterium]